MRRPLHCVRCLGFFVAVAVVSSASAKSPNIVLILADDVGREVLGCYGGTSYDTPNIDRMAARGVRFEHAYTMPMCHPTRTTLLTGQYPFRLGHPQWGTFPRAAEQRTLVNLLKQAGYATAIAGKWQLALLKDDLEQPHRLGFDEYCLYGWHEGPWYYQPHIWHNGTLRTDIRNRYGPDVICDEVIDFLERNRRHPFFMFYSMELCHAETNDLDKPAPVGPHGRYDSYAEMVAKMDACVGRVIAAVERFGLREDTLVLFTTDNGTAAHTLVGLEGDRLIYEPVVSKLGDREIRGGKATLTDWGTRVPLIASRPGTIESGGECDDLVDVSDLLPTLVALTGGGQLPSGVKLDGQSITRLTGLGTAPRSWVFAEHEGRFFVRDRRWKLYSDGQFYDMEADPYENKPLDCGTLSSAARAGLDELRRAQSELDYVKPSG